MSKALQKYSTEFNSIIDAINAYIKLSYTENVDLTSDESEKITLGCVNALSRIAEICFEYGKYKDEFEYDSFYHGIYGPELVINSNKTRCTYKLGLNGDGIYLSTDLRYNDNLRYMDDNFWRMLMELSSLEGFEHEEYEYTSNEQRSKFPDLFKTNKSMIFRIMRKHFFDITDENWRQGSSSVGEFKVLFSKQIRFDLMLEHCCESFKKMYKLNYKLWKVTDLKNKTKK